MSKGKYEDECDKVLADLNAEGIVLIVLGGPKGSGFSVSLQAHLLEKFSTTIPGVLRDVANQIERGVRNLRN